MKRRVIQGILAVLLLGMLCGCTQIGQKTASLSVIYIAAAVLSLLLMVGYCVLVKKKEIWMLLLFGAVVVVNLGYVTLAVSETLEQALWANRIAYLGSVFLPLSMLMSILNVTRLKYPKWLPGVLFFIALGVFCLAASPGYLDLYYKSVTLEKVGGVSVLCKEYGAWHPVYLFYLLGYFVTMVAAILHAIVKKKLESVAHAVFLAGEVFVNLGVWLLGQLVKIDFEFLSVSYLISEMFLIGLYLMLEYQEKLLERVRSDQKPAVRHVVAHEDSPEYQERCNYLRDHLHTLTPSERTVFELYCAGKTSKEIMQELHIAENTLKYHNRNLYGKLGVSSRKQLLEYAKAVEKTRT